MRESRQGKKGGSKKLKDFLLAEKKSEGLPITIPREREEEEEKGLLSLDPSGGGTEDFDPIERSAHIFLGEKRKGGFRSVRKGTRREEGGQSVLLRPGEEQRKATLLRVTRKGSSLPS